MPTITDTAVCIRHWDFSETSQTVSLFTREHGVIRGLAKGSRRDKGPFSGGIDLLTRGQVVAIIKPALNLATITAWHLEELYRALRQSLPANRAGLYMADLVHHLLIDEDPHVRVFDSFIASLAALAQPARIDRTLLEFQWVLLSETGYKPQLDRDASTGKPLSDKSKTLVFSAQAGGVVEDGGRAPPSATESGDRWRVRRQTVDVLRRLSAGETLIDGESLGDGESISRANRLLAAYFRHIIGLEPPTMRWAFSNAVK